MRSDGTRVKKADLLYTVVPHIMPHRYDSMNMLNVDIPVDPMHDYINQKRKDGIAISHVSLIMAAYLRATAEYPLLNRFVVNRKIYDRNEFCVGMVVLKQNGEEDATASKIYFDLNDTIFDVQRKVDEYIEKCSQPVANNNTDKMAARLGNAGGLIRFAVSFFRLWDKTIGLPKKLIDLSPFHCSLFVTDMASIRTNYIYHHVYDFGTTSVFIAMGKMREVAFREKGEIVFKRCLPLGIVTDERICSGHYFAMALQRIEKYLKNPRLLEEPFEPKSE